MHFASHDSGSSRATKTIRRPRILAIAAATLSVATIFAGGCGHRQARRLTQASEALGKDVGRGDAAQVRGHVVPGVQASTDVDAMLKGTARKSWSRTLSDPVEVRPEAIVFLTPDQPVRVVWTEQGWRFAEDPTDVYAQSTPRQALRAMVIASRRERWDVMLELAPRRYRTGLSVKDLERAWTEGEHAQALRERRDRLADHLSDAIVQDAHEATLDLGEGHMARLEREGSRWVVVEF